MNAILSENIIAVIQDDKAAIDLVKTIIDRRKSKSKKAIRVKSGSLIFLYKPVTENKP